ncbi:MAG: GNAT family N-acetyltransferase [Candidatus Marinimicrobia bacterium]|nr:GNAT family N-acetyltransferase [Candidatus Neomarinimicrobiota bacterium]MDD5581936.1 GNAT family N-acetyltransferase [Candidatus Neomarinimicrobiota bacterium]
MKTGKTTVMIERFDPTMHTFWDSFVMASNNGTLFHERHFLNYHPTGRFIDHSLVFKTKKSVVSLFPAVEYEQAGMKILHSHRGASFGGFVQLPDMSLDMHLQITDFFLHYLHDQNFDRVIITIPPIIYNKRLSNYSEFALFRNHFRYLKRDISSVLYLEDSIEKNIEKFRPTTRTAFRKAIKMGVTVKKTDDYASFYEILKKNLKIRHNVQPTHTLEELEDIKRRYPTRIHLYAAYLQEKMIAGIVLFDANDQVTLAFYISHDEAYQEYRGVNYLFKEVINDCIQRGFSYLDFGIFTVNMEPNLGLARFKESFGAGGIFRDTFYLDLK